MNESFNPNDIFGGDIIVDDRELMKNHVLWEAHPNIERNRVLGIGHGRALDDEDIISELLDTLTEWIY